MVACLNSALYYVLCKVPYQSANKPRLVPGLRGADDRGPLVLSNALRLTVKALPIPVPPPLSCSKHSTFYSPVRFLASSALSSHHPDILIITIPPLHSFLTTIALFVPAKPIVLVSAFRHSIRLNLLYLSKRRFRRTCGW